MTSKPTPSAFAALGFTRLSAVSYIYTPTATSTILSTSPPPVLPLKSDEGALPTTPDLNSTDPAHASSQPFIPHPDLIIFPSWLDAQPKHSAKYLHGYRTLYPTSTIIIITHRIIDDIVGTRANKLTWYGPVASYIQSLPPTANVLLHSVSNGGALSIVAVAQIYQERTGKPLPIRAQVLDSSPGKPSFWSDINAVTNGVPSLPLRLVARILVTLFSFAAKLLYTLIRKKHPIIRLRAQMVDPSLFSAKAPRVYVYSKEDKMVSWKAVEEHIVQAREMGYKAEGEEYKGSKHVAHMMVDSDRYWKVVENVWRRGFEREKEVKETVDELLW